MTTTRDERIRVGISACLLGEPVRYDGGHKRDRYITDTLGEYFEWVPVCPEVDIGMGTPREPIRLEDQDGTIRLVSVQTSHDFTDRMQTYSRRRAEELSRQDLSGYLLKSKSPSCGMERVKVYHGRGAPRKDGIGLFAEELIRRCPNLPVEEEGRLNDPRLRENWIERVFAYHDLKRLFRPRWKVGELVRFHTRYKFVLMAHSQKSYQGLGRLVAEAKSAGREELRSRYEAEFMAALGQIATTRKNANVLEHILGFFKKDLDAASRRELREQIEDYRRGVVPLIVPLVLIRHYVRLLEVDYLRDQVYLNPHPKELALRNHV